MEGKHESHVWCVARRFADDGHVQQRPAFALPPRFAHDTEEGNPELVPWESVQRQIEEGVESSQRPGENVHRVHNVCHARRHFQRVSMASFYPHHSQDVIRQEAEAENQQDQHGDAPGSSTGQAAGVGPRGQLFHHADVAHVDHHQGEQEPQHGQDPAVPPHHAHGDGAGKVQAPGLVVDPDGGYHGPHGSDLNGGEDPNRRARQHSPNPLLHLCRQQGFDHHHVAEHGKAGEEEDAPVQVEMEAEAYEAAHEVAEGPQIVVAVVVDQEGHAEDVEEVGQGQVDHDDAAALPGTQLGQVNEDGGQVPQQTHDEDGPVGHR